MTVRHLHPPVGENVLFGIDLFRTCSDGSFHLEQKHLMFEKFVITTQVEVSLDLVGVIQGLLQNQQMHCPWTASPHLLTWRDRLCKKVWGPCPSLQSRPLFMWALL